MVFSKKKNLNYSFILQDKQLEVVEKFSYLGIIFKYNGTFFDTKKKLVDQAQRSLHFIYKTIRNESIPVDLQLKLFDSMIEPILLYGYYYDIYMFPEGIIRPVVSVSTLTWFIKYIYY